MMGTTHALPEKLSTLVCLICVDLLELVSCRPAVMPSSCYVWSISRLGFARRERTVALNWPVRTVVMRGLFDVMCWRRDCAVEKNGKVAILRTAGVTRASIPGQKGDFQRNN